MRLYRPFILRRLRQEPLRAVLTVAGIALGVGVVLAIRLANASSVGGFAAALDLTAGRASLEVVAPGTGLDELRLRELAWLREFGAVSPVIEGDAAIRVADGRYEAVHVLGVDVLRDQPFRDYAIVGRAPGARPRPQELLALLADPDAIVLADAFARRHQLRVGSSIDLAIGDRLRRFEIRALLAAEGPARVASGQFALMDLAAAQWALDRLGRVDRVEIRLREGADIAAAARAVAARLPDGLTVQRPSRRGEQVEAMLRAFHFNLGALSYVALLVGLFLVHDTVAVSIIARREEIGMLRALGTPRRTVLALFLGEAALLALAGAAVGVPLGWAVARGAVQLTSATVTTLYVAAAAGVPMLAWSDVALGLGVAVPLALIAAAAPALEASRVPPLAALRGSHRLDAPERVRVRPLAAAVGLLLLSVAASMAGPVGGLPVFGFIAAVALVFGVAFLAPSALAGLAAAGARPLAAVFGIEGRLAHANLAAAIPRLAVSVAALAVSLSMMVAIAIMIGSFRETVIYWVGQTLQADLFVSTARRSSLDTQATVSRELEQAVTSHPAVAVVDRFRSVNLEYEGRLIVLATGDFGVTTARGTLVFKEPRDGKIGMARAAGRDEVVVSEAFAIKGGIRAGDTIRLATPAGERPFEVIGVYYDYATDRGVVVMDRRTFTRHYGDFRPTSLSVYLRPGTDPDAVRESLMRQLAGEHRVFIHTNRSLRAEVLRIFDSTFAITYALEAIAIAVGIMGVTSTLLTLIVERRRELATLRQVGADRRQVRRMVMIEAGTLGLVSQGLGLFGGLGLALILVYVINVQSFGWSIQFDVPAMFLLQSSLALFGATLLAGLYPAQLAGRSQPVAYGDEE